MSERVVTTQAELDQALADQVERITIRSPRGAWLNIGDTGESEVTVGEGSRIDRCGGRVGRVANGGSVGRVGNGGRVGRVGNGGSVGRVANGGRVGRVANGGSVGRVGNGGRVGRVGNGGSVGRVGNGGSVGRVANGGSVEWVANGGSVEWVGNGGSVEWVGNGGSVEWVDNGGSVEWVGNGGSVGRASGASSVHLYGRGNLGHAGSHVAVFLHSSTATFTGGHLIDLTSYVESDPAQWAEHHGAVTAEDRVTVYKAVRDDYRSQHGALYEIGAEVSCDDFEDTDSCGHGLHFSPSPVEAKSYDSDATRFLECTVLLSELRPITGSGAAKCKTRRAQVVREVDITGRPVTAASEEEVS